MLCLKSFIFMGLYIWFCIRSASIDLVTIMSGDSTSNDLKYSFTSKYLQFEDSSSKTLRKISYYKVEGISRPGVVFIPGFMADKSHRKSLETLKYCRDNGISCVSYDTAGYGESTDDISRKEARFTHWLQDAKEVLLKLTDGPQVVVGSSMGGWISMILAQEMPEKFCGLVLLAPAYNFAQKAIDDISSKYPEETLKKMREEGFVVERVDPKFPSYGPVPISFDLFESFLPYNLPIGENEIELKIPIRLIHGTKDEILSTQKSEALISALESNNITLLILKGCTHELSDEKGIQAIISAIKELRKISHLN